MYLAERIVLTKGIQKEEYELADRSAPLAKLLYNAALFRVRQTFTGWDKEIRTENEKEVFDELALLKKAYPKLNVRRVISYNALEKLMRVTDNPDFFAGLPMQTAQAVIKAAVQDFRNWLASRKEYRKDPSQFFEKPQMSHYCKKERKSFTITNQDAVLYPVYKETEEGENYAGRELKLPGIRHRLRLPNIPEDAELKEVKVCPWYGKYMLILVLETEEFPVSKERPFMAGVDLGTDNIAAIVTTDHASCVYKGGVVLSGNRLFHKERAEAVSILTKGRGKQNAHSRHLDYLSRKHDGFTRDVMHKISADIVRFCEEHRAGTIVIGTNPLWKQRVNMGRANNQKFMSVPHTILRRMITYKAEAAGITVVLQEESYTSKADVTVKDRMPVYGKAEEKPVFSGKREGRGLYRCHGGLVINADCNGAANILRKAIPEAWKDTNDFRFLAYPESVTFRRLNRHRAAV